MNAASSDQSIPKHSEFSNTPNSIEKISAKPGSSFTAIEAPMAASIQRAMVLTGLSRSAIYRAAGRGDIRLLKVGKRAVLVDMASARAFLARLPEARISAPKSVA